MFVALDEPVVVVVIPEVLESLVQVFEDGKGVDPKKLFLKGAPEPLDAAIALGGTNEGGAGVNAEKAQFGLKGSPRLLVYQIYL